MTLNNYQKGVVFILLSTFFFTMISVVTKALGDIPSFQRIFVMHFVATCFMFTQKKQKTLQTFKTHWPLLTLRASLGFLSTITYFYAINNLPLASATLLNKTSPFFVTFFSIIWLKERVSALQIVSILTAILGAGLVINPSFNVDLMPLLIALISGATAGAAYTTVRKVSHKVSPRDIVLYFMGFSTLTSIPPMLIQGMVWPSFMQFLGMISLGLFICLGQLSLSYAYQYEEASKISIYSFAQIIFGICFGLLIFKEIPTPLTLFGALIIITSGYMDYKYTLTLQTTHN